MTLAETGGNPRPRRPYDVHFLGAKAAVSAVHAGPNPVDDDPRLKRMRVEAVMLLAKTPLTTRKLAQLAYLADGTEARTLVRQLNQVYETHGRGLRVEQVAGGYRLMTRPALSPWLTKLGHLPPAMRLSTPMMETLAVVAYRQPVSRASAEAVRGVACGELLRQLMERDLIRIAGRSEELGRPYLYGTTKRFLQLFGLPNTDALPPIRWQTLQDDPAQDDDAPESIPLDSTTDELSTSPKESVVSTAVAPILPDAADPEALAALAATQTDLPQDQATRSSIDDDDDDGWDDDDDDGDSDEDDDLDEDWDDDDDDLDGDDDDDLDDDDDDDDDLDDLDDDEADEWQEVDDDDDEDWDDDDDDDEDWDDDDEEDESADDDEEWS